MTQTYRLLNFVVNTNGIRWFLLTDKQQKFSISTDLPFRDYFICDEDQVQTIRKLYPKYSYVELDETHEFAEFHQMDKKAWKVILPNHMLKFRMRKKLEEEHSILISEADINYKDRVMIDLDIKGFVKINDEQMIVSAPKPKGFPDLRVGYCDYETDDRQEVLDASKYKTFAKPDVSRILSMSIGSEKTGKIIHLTSKNEGKLLNRANIEFKNFDVIQYWNGIEFDEKFDERFELHKIPFNPNEYIRLDAMRIHEMLNVKERMFLRLDTVAKRYLDIEKIKHIWTFYEAFMKHLEELQVYNDRDVEIMMKLDKKFGFHNIVLMSAEQIGFLPQKYVYSRYSSIIAIMRVSLNHHGKRIIWKSKSDIEEKRMFKGSIVQDPLKGLWTNVIGIDLASLYNTVIQTWNISPEQIVYHSDGSHTYDRYNHEGIMSRVLRVFEVDRNKYKTLRDNEKNNTLNKLYDTIQAGLKVVLLSIYGGLGARGSTVNKSDGTKTGPKSFYNFDCASDVTKYSREIITIAKEVSEEMEYLVVYGDTDSIYIYIGEDVTIDKAKEILNKIVKGINKKYKAWFDRDKIPLARRKIRMEQQGLYSPFVLFDVKKKYFAKEVYNAENNKIHTEFKLYAKGIKAEKTSEPVFIRTFQRTVTQMLLEGETESQIRQFVDDTRTKFLNGENDKDIVFETKLSRKVSQYKTNPPHVRLARRLIRQGKIAEKSSVEYVYVSYHKEPKVDVEGTQIEYTGRKYVWDNRIQDSIFEMIDAVFKKVAKLDEWF